MQLFAVLLFIAAVAAMIPMTEGTDPALRSSTAELASDLDADQFEIFTEAAWPAARAGIIGPIARADMQLPPAFRDATAAELSANADGDYLYVWTGDNRPSSKRPDLIFAGRPKSSVEVGISSSNAITMRDGTSVPRPAFVPYPNLVARIPL